jgi:alpha-tubulin suppressor-like RCC1 family protein
MFKRILSISLALGLVMLWLAGTASAARYQDKDNGTVLDTDTGLMWYKDAMPAKTGMPLEMALGFVNSLNKEEALGYSDWRLPKLEELYSLVAKGKSYPSLDRGHPFEDVRPDFYWTSSTGYNLVGYAWVVDMGSGGAMRAEASYCNFFYVWPVRTEREDVWSSPVKAAEQTARAKARALPTFLDLFDVEIARPAISGSGSEYIAPPAGLSAVALSMKEISLSWSPSGEGIGHLYNVYSDGQNIRSVEGTSIRLEGLAPNTTKCFTVVARSEDGNESEPSREICATTWRGDLEKGTVWAIGINGFGQLGDGTKSDNSRPVQVERLRGVVAVSAGNEHSLAVKDDGTVWAWGRNTRGQLGDGTTKDALVPRKVQGLENIIAVAAGWYHSMALSSDGKVWAWGRNYYGQLGNGNRLDSLRPVNVKKLTGIDKIAAGWYHSMALSSDGKVWVWGWNRHGQLGDDKVKVAAKPVAVKLPRATDIAAGMEHSVALLADGTALAWGRNNDGQLGAGHLVENPYPFPVKGLAGAEDIECGMHYCLALLNDGRIMGWGKNDYGQLGEGLGIRVSEPASVQLPGMANMLSAGAHQAAAVLDDGTLWTWGWDYTSNKKNEPPKPVKGIAGFDRVVSGVHYLIMLKGS